MAVDTTKKVKRARTAKARKICLLSETEITGVLTFAKNSDEAMDLIDAAQKEGKTLYFKRLTMPAPTPKVVV
jgi:hypothetical protein